MNHIFLSINSGFIISIYPLALYVVGNNCLFLFANSILLSLEHNITNFFFLISKVLYDDSDIT